MKQAAGSTVRLTSELGLPLHRQLARVLSEQIASGRYQEGELLPSEDELRQLYGVSLITVRSALATLESDNLIDRRSAAAAPMSARAPGSAAACRSCNEKLAFMEAQQTHPPEADRARKPAKRRLMSTVNRFGCDAKTPFLHVVRVRFTTRPMLLLTTYIPEEIGRLFSRSDLYPHAAL